MFLEIFRRSNIPCLSEVVQEVPVYDHKSLAECPYGAALLQEVQTYVNSWAPLTFDSSQANSIIGKFWVLLACKPTAWSAALNQHKLSKATRALLRLVVLLLVNGILVSI